MGKTLATIEPKRQGRPPGLAKQLREAKSLAKRLRLGMTVGWEDLSKEYSPLMRLAIAMARGKDVLDERCVCPTHCKTDTTVLMRLLELLPRVAGKDEGDGEDSPIQRILKEFRDSYFERANVTNIQVNYRQPVDENGKEHTVRTENYAIP